MINSILNIIDDLKQHKSVNYIKEYQYIEYLLYSKKYIFWHDAWYPYKFCQNIINNDNIFCKEYRKNGYLVCNKDIIYTDKDNNEYVLFNHHKIYINNYNDEEDLNVLYTTLFIDLNKESPHNYDNYLNYLEDKIVKGKKNIIVDCGSSEGAFEILVANKYNLDDILFVCIDLDIKYNENLEKTLNELNANYIIINQNLTNEITLTDIFNENKLNIEDIICIKADIEGDEIKLINQFKDNFNIIKPLCLICTYHNQDDAYDLYNIFNNYYDYIEFSNGYVLAFYMGEIKYPYFRKALIITH